MTEITIRCTNCGLGFESDYDLEQNLIDPETGEIHDGCPTCKTDAYLMDIKEDFIQRLRGRAEFCRDRGEVKTPELLEHAAQLLEEKAQAVQEGFVLVNAEQLNQWGHMANAAEQYGCCDCFESRGYAHNLACEINSYFEPVEAQEQNQ